MKEVILVGQAFVPVYLVSYPHDSTKQDERVSISHFKLFICHLSFYQELEGRYLKIKSNLT